MWRWRMPRLPRGRWQWRHPVLPRRLPPRLPVVSTNRMMTRRTSKPVVLSWLIFHIHQRNETQQPFLFWAIGREHIYINGVTDVIYWLLEKYQEKRIEVKYCEVVCRDYSLCTKSEKLKELKWIQLFFLFACDNRHFCLDIALSTVIWYFWFCWDMIITLAPDVRLVVCSGNASPLIMWRLWHGYILINLSLELDTTFNLFTSLKHLDFSEELIRFSFTVLRIQNVLPNYNAVKNNVLYEVDCNCMMDDKVF